MLHLIRSGKLTGHKWFLGGSTGALRSCALLSSSLSPSEVSLTEALKEHMVGMVYKHGDTPETLAPMMAGLYNKVLPPSLTESVISHPTLHLAIMVTQILPPYADLPAWRLKAMFWWFLGANFVSRQALHSFQRRLCFYSGPHPPPFISPGDDVECVPLTTTNAHQVLQATTCLPFISPHCEHIDGVGRGLFVDGALSNYHLSLASSLDYPVLLLGEGPGPFFKQTLWDSYVPYRQAPAAFQEHVSVLHPNSAFVQKLLARRLPNTFDYFKEEYIKRPELRHAHWRHCYDTSLQHFPSHPADLLPPSHASAAPAATTSIWSALTFLPRGLGLPWSVSSLARAWPHQNGTSGGQGCSADMLGGRSGSSSGRSGSCDGSSDGDTGAGSTRSSLRHEIVDNIYNSCSDEGLSAVSMRSKQAPRSWLWGAPVISSLVGGVGQFLFARGGDSSAGEARQAAHGNMQLPLTAIGGGLERGALVDSSAAQVCSAAGSGDSPDLDDGLSPSRGSSGGSSSSDSLCNLGQAAVVAADPTSPLMSHLWRKLAQLAPSKLVGSVFKEHKDVDSEGSEGDGDGDGEWERGVCGCVARSRVQSKMSPV